MKIFLEMFLKLLLAFTLVVIPCLSNAQEMDLRCDVIQKAKFPKAKLKICGKTLDVEIADNEWFREIGLMCRDSMPENNGMIFVFDDEKELSFWMKNTRMPLTVGYFGKNKRLIDTYDMEPLSETKFYTSTKKSLYALETNVGWFTKNKIKPGCKFELITERKKPVTKGQ